MKAYVSPEMMLIRLSDTDLLTTSAQIGVKDLGGVDDMITHNW